MSTIQTSSEVTFPRRLLYKDRRFRRMAGCASSTVELLFTCWEYTLCPQEKKKDFTEDSPSALSHCNDSCSSYSWPSGGTPTLFQGTKGHCMWHRKLRLCGCSNDTTRFYIQSPLSSRGATSSLMRRQGERPRWCW